MSVPVRAGQADFLFQIPSPGAASKDGAVSKDSDGAGKGPQTAEYILTIDSKDFLFRSYRVDVSEGMVEIWEVTRGVPWDRPGSVALGGVGAGGDADAVLEVGVLGRRAFFEQRATCMFLLPFSSGFSLDSSLGSSLGSPHSCSTGSILNWTMLMMDMDVDSLANVIVEKPNDSTCCRCAGIDIWHAEVNGE